MAQTIGGGSLLVAWQLKGKNVLIIGGGEVASHRVESILVTDAHIIILCPTQGLHPHTKYFIDEQKDRVTHRDGLFATPEDLRGMDMVLTALNDVDLSRNICNMCRAEKIPVNAADIPEACDFYFGSQIRDGPLQIMISTNGNGPKMANLVKKKLENALSGVEGQAVAKVGELRAQLKLRALGVGGALGKKRMKWMTSVCNAWEMEELALLNRATMQNLLDEGWEKDRVPTFHELGHYHKSGLSYIFPTPRLALTPVVGFMAGALFGFVVTLIRHNIKS